MVLRIAVAPKGTIWNVAGKLCPHSETHSEICILEAWLYRPSYVLSNSLHEV